MTNPEALQVCFTFLMLGLTSIALWSTLWGLVQKLAGVRTNSGDVADTAVETERTYERHRRDLKGH